MNSRKWFLIRASITTQAHIRRQLGLVERHCQSGNRRVATQNGQGCSCHALSPQELAQNKHGVSLPHMIWKLPIPTFLPQSTSKSVTRPCVWWIFLTFQPPLIRQNIGTPSLVYCRCLWELFLFQDDTRHFRSTGSSHPYSLHIHR